MFLLSVMVFTINHVSSKPIDEEDKPINETSPVNEDPSEENEIDDHQEENKNDDDNESQNDEDGDNQLSDKDKYTTTDDDDDLYDDKLESYRSYHLRHSMKNV